MKAVRIHEFGGIDVLRVEDISQPKPGEGEVLVFVHAASVNPVDYKIREGRYPAVKADQLPVVLGRDVAGVVTSRSTARWSPCGHPTRPTRASSRPAPRH